MGEGEGEGEGEETETRNETRRTEKIVAAQQARESLHSWESHTEMRGDEAAVAFYPDLFWSLTKLDRGIYTTTATLCAK